MWMVNPISVFNIFETIKIARNPSKLLHFCSIRDKLYLFAIERVIQEVLGKLKFLNGEWYLGEFDIDEEGKFLRRYHKVSYRFFR